MNISASSRSSGPEDPAEHQGEFYSFKPLHCQPQPVQKPHPPIWIGGHSKAALRRTARLGDGWHPVGATAAVPLPPEELTRMLDELKRMTEAEGRDFSKLTISYKAPIYEKPTGGANRSHFLGTADQVAEDIHTFGKLGVSELIFNFRSNSINESLDGMETFATEIMPLAR